MYLYPVIRTVIMSFFGIESVTADLSEWSFNGLDNYIRIFEIPTFIRAMTNMLLIWLIGGVIVLAFALLFAVILTSGIRFKKFFRAAIYLPNIISAVALAAMWIQYIYSQEFGLLNKILNIFGMEGKNWLGTDEILGNAFCIYIWCSRILHADLYQRHRTYPGRSLRSGND